MSITPSTQICFSTLVHSLGVMLDDNAVIRTLNMVVRLSPNTYP